MAAARSATVKGEDRETTEVASAGLTDDDDLKIF